MTSENLGRIRTWASRGLVLAACAVANAGQDTAAGGRQTAPAPMTLAEARAAFSAADADRNAILNAAELAAVGLSAEDVKLADRDADGALRSEEYLGALPLVLLRSGRRASPELEAEAIRLRTLGAPAPARASSAGAPGSGTTGARGTVTSAGGGAPAPVAGGAARERLVSAVRGPVEMPQPTAERSAITEPGPAVSRLRNAELAEDSQARLEAARRALAERLQRTSRIAPPGSPTAPGETVSAQRRRAQAAEREDGSPTAQRLRAARQKLDERIRSSPRSDAPSPQAEPAPARPRPSVPPQEVQPPGRDPGSRKDGPPSADPPQAQRPRGPPPGR